MRLTDAIIQKLAAAGTKEDECVFDERVPGFGVRFRRANGRLNSATFIFQYHYTATDRVQRRMSLGRVSALSIDQARATAAAFYADIKAFGRDPQGERYANRKGHQNLRIAEHEVAALEQRISDLRRRINA